MKSSIVAALLGASLLFAPIVHADTTTAPINNPYADTLQLWATIATSIEAIAQEAISATFGALSVVSPPTSAHPQAPAATTPQQTASLAEAVASFETPAATATENTATSTTPDQTTSAGNAGTASSAPSAAIQSASLTSATPAFNAGGYVTQSEVAQQLLQLSNSLTSQINSNSASALTVPAWAPSQAINQLDNVTITNANLTASEIPALDYLSLSGGTLSGTLNVPTLNASTTTFGLLTVANASSTNFSNFGTAYFGGTATSSFDSAGDLTVAGSLIANGNVGIGTTTPGALLSANGNILGAGTLALTGTTGTTTIASGQGFTIGGSQFVLQQGSGNVGIGTTSPATTLSVNGSGYLTGGLGVGVLNTTAGTIQTPGTIQVDNPSTTYSGAMYGSFSALGETYPLQFQAVGTQGAALLFAENANTGQSFIESGEDSNTYGSSDDLLFTNIWNQRQFMVIKGSSGNVGIGTASPYSRLQLTGPDSASSTSAFAVVNSASTTEFAVFDGGNAELAGSLSQNSDQRLKTNIQSLTASSSLSLIDSLNPVTFNWIDPTE